MLNQKTVDLLAYIGSSEDGASRLGIRTNNPDLVSTAVSRLLGTGLLECAKGSTKKDDRFTLSAKGQERLDHYIKHPEKIAKAYSLSKPPKPPVKVPSRMDEKMREHLQNEARIGNDNDLINGILETVYATIISGLDQVQENPKTKHPMELHNQALRLKLVSLKEQLEK